MRHSVIVALCLLVAGTGFSQSASLSLQIADKQVAAVEDAVALFMYSTEGKSSGYAKDASILKNKGILPAIYEPKTPLTKGVLAYMLARHLKINRSLMFNIFNVRRYAVTACVAKGYLPAGSGEFDRVSGTELLEIMGKLSGE